MSHTRCSYASASSFPKTYLYPESTEEAELNQHTHRPIRKARRGQGRSTCRSSGTSTSLPQVWTLPGLGPRAPCVCVWTHADLCVLSVCGAQRVCACAWTRDMVIVETCQLMLLFWHKWVKAKRKGIYLKCCLYTLRCTQKYNFGRTLVKKYYLWTNSSKDRKGAMTSSAGFS